MRIAIVNDSQLAVESLRRALARAPRHRLAWIAQDGEEAVRKCGEDAPDIVLMDLFMPVMDGVEATRLIMARSPCAILVVTADVEHNVSKVFEAMGAGALDAVNTPAREDDETHSPLLRKIESIGKIIGHPRLAPEPSAADADLDDLFAIGASTGGPGALAEILAPLPSDFPAALLIVQHVDVQFAQGLADWLGQSCRLPVKAAREGDRPQPGQALLAATNDHMILTARRRLAYTPDPLDYPYRPSIDIFFESVARHWPKPSVAALLTGMGRDGANGLLRLRQAGWRTLAQNRESCAVYGMPKAAAELGAAQRILSPSAIAEELLACVETRRGIFIPGE
jgi:two-component system response regulator WspF